MSISWWPRWQRCRLSQALLTVLVLHRTLAPGHGLVCMAREKALGWQQSGEDSDVQKSPDVEVARSGGASPSLGDVRGRLCGGTCRVPARPAVWPPSSRHRACVRPRRAGRFYRDRQQFSSAEATSARLPPSLLVNSPEGKASGRGTAGASRLADVGSSCACHSDRRSCLRARRGACARCPVRSRQRSRHLPSPRLSAASLGHFEDGTSPGRAGTPRSPFPVWQGAGTVRQGQASPPAAVGSRCS